MRYRSAIPAPPQRFRRMPGWRQRKCIGGIITITAIIVGIAGTTVIIIITTTIIATGIAGKRGGPGQISHRPASARACFDLKGCLAWPDCAPFAVA